MLSERFDTQLTYIFKNLTENESVIEISGWFCVAQWIDSIVGKGWPIDQFNIKSIYLYDDFEFVISSLGLDRYRVSDYNIDKTVGIKGATKWLSESRNSLEKRNDIWNWQRR